VNTNDKAIPKLCKNCDLPVLNGRIDKVFCSDSCRIDYNNRIKMEKRVALPDFVKNIQKSITENYKILHKLKTSGATIISEEKLIKMGFDFNYITSYHTTKKGDIYRFCFDHGYLKIKENQVLLVVQKNQVELI